MKILSLQLPLMFLVFLPACKGQVKTSFPTDSFTQPKTTVDGQSKLIKTHGTGQQANVHCGLQDKAGNLWFGTTGEGIYRYDGKTFTNFTTNNGLSSNDIWCIFEDKDSNLWFGTGDGVCVYNSSSSKGTSSKAFLTLRMTASLDSAYFPHDNKLIINPTAKNAVWSILQDKTGIFWFGTSDGVYRYNGKNPLCIF